jgi:NTE family protein
VRLIDELHGKRFGLVLSAGYFGFFGHAGLLQALEEHALKPAAFAGTSAGALVAAMAASGMSAQQIERLLVGIVRRDFWDPSPRRWAMDLLAGRGVTGLLEGRRFRSLLERHLPVARIEDCTSPLVIVTSDVTNAKSFVHTSGALASTVHASCAYPGLFRTVDEAGAQLWDGGLIDKAPLVALADAQPDLEALLVMYLPSSAKKGEKAPRRYGYLGGLAQGLAAVRHEHYELQARLCEARGLPVYVLSPTLTALGPNKLKLGPQALGEAAAFARTALREPPDRFRSFARER